MDSYYVHRDNVEHTSIIRCSVAGLPFLSRAWLDSPLPRIILQNVSLPAFTVPWRTAGRDIDLREMRRRSSPTAPEDGFLDFLDVSAVPRAWHG